MRRIPVTGQHSFAGTRTPLDCLKVLSCSRRRSPRSPCVTTPVSSQSRNKSRHFINVLFGSRARREVTHMMRVQGARPHKREATYDGLQVFPYLQNGVGRARTGVDRTGQRINVTLRPPRVRALSNCHNRCRQHNEMLASYGIVVYLARTSSSGERT
jgi:hypothetical protein